MLEWKKITWANSEVRALERKAILTSGLKEKVQKKLIKYEGRKFSLYVCQMCETGYRINRRSWAGRQPGEPGTSHPLA